MWVGFFLGGGLPDKLRLDEKKEEKMSEKQSEALYISSLDFRAGRSGRKAGDDFLLFLLASILFLCVFVDHPFLVCLSYFQPGRHLNEWTISVERKIGNIKRRLIFPCFLTSLSSSCVCLCPTLILFCLSFHTLSLFLSLLRSFLRSVPSFFQAPLN